MTLWQCSRYVGVVVALCLVAAPLCGQDPVPVPQQEQEDYTVSKQDVLNVTVIDQPELTGKYTVDADGSLRFPLVGRVSVAGKKLHDVEAELRGLLANGFLKNPQVALSLDQFKGKRVFIFGAAGAPGMYPLTDGMTLIEFLVKAGSAAASEVVIVRNKGARAPVLPDNSGDSEIIRVNLREFEKDVERGEFSRNIFLQDGDSIFVPRVDRNRIFVTGQVKLPGAYSVPEGTTVLQAIALAGGITESAAMGRLRILRIVNGDNKTLRTKPEDIVQPGDTIVVPERLF